MSQPEIIVSDHAILRWMERVEKYDIARLREEIAASAAVGIRFGASAVVVGAGKIIIRDGAVVTILRRNHVRSAEIGKIEVEIVDRSIAARRRTGRRRSL